MPARPGRALFNQDFPFARRKARDLALRVQFVQQVPGCHRPGAQLRQPTGHRDIDQPCRRQTTLLQSFGQRRTQKHFKRFPGQFERVPGILQSRHAFPGMFARDHGGQSDALSRSGRRQRQDRTVVRLSHRRKFLLARPVREVSQKPHRPPRQTCERGEQAAAPCLAERRIQQTPRRVRRHPVADKRHHGQRLRVRDLRLPTINQLWQGFAKRADAEGWTAARFLAALAEHELAERDRRRIERHLREARLFPGKGHLASAISLALVENGYRVLFTRTTDPVQRMQVARRELALESLLARLDRYHLLILDD